MQCKCHVVELGQCENVARKKKYKLTLRSAFPLSLIAMFSGFRSQWTIFILLRSLMDINSLVISFLVNRGDSVLASINCSVVEE